MRLLKHTALGGRAKASGREELRKRPPEHHWHHYGVDLILAPWRPCPLWRWRIGSQR